MELSGGQFLQPVQKLVATVILSLQKERKNASRFLSAPYLDPSFEERQVVAFSFW